MTMTPQPFGKSGLNVSALGIGSIPVARGENLVVESMNRLLDAGCNLVDTAQCYPGSEDLIGRCLAHRRDEMILVTKCGHHDVLPDGSMKSKRISMEDIDGALQRLKTDRIDAMLLHSYDLDALQAGHAQEVLLKAREQGKILHAGYSGDNERAQWILDHDLFEVLECSVNLFDQWNAEHVLPRAAQQGVGVIAKRPLGNAVWRYGLSDEFNPHHQEYVARLRAMNLSINDWPSTALRFTLSLPGVTTAIASSTSVENQQANLAAVEAGPLDAETVGAIRDAFQQAEAASGQVWESCN